MSSRETLPFLDKPSLCYHCEGIFISKASRKAHIESDHKKSKDMHKEIIYSNTDEGELYAQYLVEYLPSQNEGEENENTENPTVNTVKETTSSIISDSEQFSDLVFGSNIEKKTMSTHIIHCC